MSQEKLNNYSIRWKLKQANFINKKITESLILLDGSIQIKS